MNKKIIASILVCFLWVEMFSQAVSISDATFAANNIYKAFGKSLPVDVAPSIHTLQKADTILIYEFIFPTGDMIMLSGNFSCQPLLAYSMGTNANSKPKQSILDNLNSAPEGLVFFIEDYASQIERSYALTDSDTIYQQEWSYLLSDNADRNQFSEVVSPLLASIWGQDVSNDYLSCDAYNYLISSTDEECACNKIVKKCPTGCVATAMAQIMYYWKYPVYLPNQSYQYDWCNMKDMLLFYTSDYEISRQAISLLLADCGQILNMNYCNRGCKSSADPRDVPEAFSHFGYLSSNRKLKSSHLNNWTDMLKQDLDSGRPVMYDGYNINQLSGHSFVCDGYDNQDYFHFNWGWGGFGEYDVWCTLNQINSQGNTYNSYQAAVFNIYPAYTQDYCDFNLPLWMHYYNYYTLLGDTIPDPHLNVPKTFTTLTSVPLDNAYPATWRTIPTGESSEYVAHKEVVLQAGFTAEAGCTFVARIEPCVSCEEGDGFRRRPLPYKPEMMDKNIVETFHGTSPQDGTAGGLLVYPNPTAGTVTVEAKGDSPIRNVTVLDMSGRVMDGVSHTPQSENSYICTLNLQHLESGIYLIRALTADGKTVSGKVVKN